MNEIQIEYYDGVKVVDHRKVRTYLGVTRRHDKWIQEKVDQLHLEHGVDYFVQKTDKINGETRGRQTIVYYLTERAFDHIGMSDEGEKGVAIRDAFRKARDYADLRRQTAFRLPIEILERLDRYAAGKYQDRTTVIIDLLNREIPKEENKESIV